MSKWRSRLSRVLKLQGYCGKSRLRKSSASILWSPCWTSCVMASFNLSSSFQVESAMFVVMEQNGGYKPNREWLYGSHWFGGLGRVNGVNFVFWLRFYLHFVVHFIAFLFDLNVIFILFYIQSTYNKEKKRKNVPKTQWQFSATINESLILLIFTLQETETWLEHTQHFSMT